MLENNKSKFNCFLANDNSVGQVVISGDLKAVEKVIELSKKNGVKRAILLPVSAPFHCRLMEPARAVMEEALENIQFNTPLIPVVSNVTASPETNPIILKQNLIDQVTGTVRWRETMQLAKDLGIKKIFELGSGKVLTGIANRMIDNVSAKCFENPEDYQDLI